MPMLQNYKVRATVSVTVTDGAGREIVRYAACADTAGNSYEHDQGSVVRSDGLEAVIGRALDAADHDAREHASTAAKNEARRLSR